MLILFYLEVAVFDESLDRRIWSLSEQRMDFDREVATKRRTRPQEVESLMHDILQRQRAADEEDDPNADELSDDPSGDSGLPGRRLLSFLVILVFSSASRFLPFYADEKILAEAQANMAEFASLTDGLHQVRFHFGRAVLT